jgi:acyl-CoA thioesterase II
MRETVSATSPILGCFELEQTGPVAFTGPSLFEEQRPVVFGGQIMGQMIVAASRFEPAKQVKSLHVIFARAGNVSRPVEIALDPFQSGRAFGSIEATASQGDRLLSRGLILMDAGEGDVIRHQTPEKPYGDPLACPEAVSADHGGVDVRIVDGVDLMTTAVTGPPELGVWIRFRQAPGDPAIHQALLSWYTDPFLIASAMRPHDGVGQVQAHESLSTGVITHTLTFHESFRADEWLLIANKSLHAGGGRTYGEGHVFTEAGRLVASFTQTNMIRHFRADAARGRDAGAM